MKKVALFYDANCFTTIPLEDLKYAIREFENFITSPVKSEIQEGRNNNPNRTEFDLVLTPEGKLTNDFNEVTLNYCDKDRTADMNTNPLIYLKANPLVCSSYYTWLISATNPAIITDFYRHGFNEILHHIKHNSPDLKHLLEIETLLRVAESQGYEKNDIKIGRNPTIKHHWILKSRRKRIDEVKNKSLKLSDYQTLTVSMLYACFNGRPTAIISSDRDILDIRENLFRSIIERFATNELLTEKIQNFNDEELKLYHEKGTDIELTIGDIGNKVKIIIDRIKKEQNIIPLTILLYKNNLNKVFTYTERIPLWLREFILEYKKALDCYSIESGIEMKYNIKYTMDPNYSSGIVKYHVFSRNPPIIKACWIYCEQHCIYAKKEKSNPIELEEFI